MDARDKDLLAQAKRSLEQVAAELRECHFRKGLEISMTLAQETNKYIDEKAPWKEFKDQPQHTGNTLYHCLNVINALKISLNPFLPFSSEKLNKMLGVNEPVSVQGWNWSQDQIKPGKSLGVIEPLFTKLDDEIAETEIDRLESNSAD